MTTLPTPTRLAVLISGGGTTMVNLHDAIASGSLDAKITLVLASRRDAKGLDLARKRGLSTEVIHRKQYDQAATFSQHVFHAMREANVDLVCLAGFLSLLHIPPDYAGRVLNIHPSLLPSFGGAGMFGQRVHQAVIDAGCKVSGCTVHLADASYDTGPILVQRTCPVLPDDDAASLGARVFEQECLAYPQAIRHMQGRADSQSPTLMPPNGADLRALALQWCLAAHEGQTRHQGAPYADHPRSVEALLHVIRIEDDELHSAALLHDTVEDTDITIAQIADTFGQRVADLVAELTLPPEAEAGFKIKHQILAEHARIMSDDAKLLKLADRRHNLSDLRFRPVEKQRRYGKATLELLEALHPWPDAAEPLAYECRVLAQHYAAL